MGKSDNNKARKPAPPPDDRLTTEEVEDIRRQVQQIVAGNAGRPPGEQISVDPEDAN